MTKDMCVVLVYFLTLRMYIFAKDYAGRYIGDFVKKTSRDEGGACAIGAIGYRRILPLVEITLLWDINVYTCHVHVHYFLFRYFMF